MTCQLAVFYMDSKYAGAATEYLFINLTLSKCTKINGCKRAEVSNVGRIHKKVVAPVYCRSSMYSP